MQTDNYQGLSSARNFLLQNNSFFGNMSFVHHITCQMFQVADWQIGTYGPNCTDGDQTPHPPVALLYEQPGLTNVTIDLATIPQAIAQLHNDTTAFINGTANGLTCLLPPSADTLAWPYGGGQVNSGPTTSQDGGPSSTAGGGTSSSSPASSTPGAAGRRASLVNAPVAVALSCTLFFGVAGGIVLL